MKGLFLISLLFVLVSPVAIAEQKQGTNPFVNKWIGSMMNNGAGLNGIITHDFQYVKYSFDFKDRLYRGSKGDIPFLAKASKPVEITVEDTEGGPEGQVFILQSIAETGLYRMWETRLLVRSDGIAKVTEIALEGQNDGFPPGCPQTAYKRDLVVTLHGSPQGFNGPKIVKLYGFRRDTDTWEYVHPGFDQKMEKYCSPRPDTFIVESEVLVYGLNGQLEAADTMAAEHKGEKDDGSKGVKFFADDGVNYSGRLFNIGDGKEGLLITYTVEQPRGGGSAKIDHSTLYTYKGNGWKPIWGFDVGFNEGAGIGSVNRVEWELRSLPDPAIKATLLTNTNDGLKCPEGSVLMFAKKGGGFKPEKSDAPRSCIKKWWGSDGMLRANLKDDVGASYTKPVEEIDWRFEK